MHVIIKGSLIVAFLIILWGCTSDQMTSAPVEQQTAPTAERGTPPPEMKEGAMPPAPRTIGPNHKRNGNGGAGMLAGGKSDLVQLAKKDPLALFERGLQQCDEKYRNYTTTFIKQERLNGELGVPQTIRVKFMDEPFSVAMRWEQNAPAGDIALYVEGRHKNQMLVRPTGAVRLLVPCARVDPAGQQAMQSTLRPITQFGFCRNLRAMLDADRQAQAAGDLKIESRGIQTVEETGRPAILLVRRLPQKPGYAAALTRIYIDQEHVVPVKIEGYDWSGQLLFRYVYKDVQFNVGLTTADFEPKANELACR